MNGEHAGRKMFAGVWACTEKSAPIFAETLTALGLTREERTGTTIHEIAELLIGCRFTCTVKPREHMGRTYNEILHKTIKPLEEEED
jgi:hypothetical protein